VNAAQAYISELWRFRHFWFSLVQVDLSTRYRRSVLGLAWSLIKPLGMTAVMCIVFAALFRTNIVEYGPFVLIGLTFWGFITESVLGGCATFHLAEGYLRQIRLPAAIFPLRVTLTAGFHFTVLLPVLVVGMAFLRGLPTLEGILALSGSLAMLLVLGWSLAVLSGLVTVAFPDMRHILEMVLQIVFYLTPIIYPVEVLQNQRVAAWLLAANPLAHVLETLRAPLLDGVPAPATNYAVAAVFTVVTTLLAVGSLARVERRLVFWL
jgi:lipopolysaccharide transport system permease protein